MRTRARAGRTVRWLEATLVAASAFTASDLGARETAGGATASSTRDLATQAAAAAIASPSGDPGAGETATETVAPSPSEIVAARIHAALRAPDTPESWAALAEALPSLSAAGSANAARLADSIAEATARQSGVVAGSTQSLVALPDGGVARARAAARRIDAGIRALGVSPTTFAASAALAGALLLAAGGLARRRARVRAERRTWSTKPIDGVQPESAMWVVRDLADQGVSLLEISRRTGLAQDVLRFLLARSDAHRLVESGVLESAVVPRTELPGDGPVPGTGVHFRDGMLTYGGAAR